MTAPTVKVKPLEWPTEPRHNGIYRTKHTGVGIYYVMRVHAQNRVSWRCSEAFGWNDSESEHAAKAAAQADYEASILSAIDTTDLEALIGAVLAEAAEEVRTILLKDAKAAEPYDPIFADERREYAEELPIAILALRPTAITALDRAKREARVEMFEQIWAAIERLHVKATAVDALNAIAPIIRALIKAERGKP